MSSGRSNVVNGRTGPACFLTEWPGRDGKINHRPNIWRDDVRGRKAQGQLLLLARLCEPEMIFPAFRLASQYPLSREELLLVLKGIPDIGQGSLCSQMEKLVVVLLKATRIPTLIASVDLNHQGFLGPLGSPRRSP